MPLIASVSWAEERPRDDEREPPKPRFAHFALEPKDASRAQGQGPFAPGHTGSAPSAADVQRGQQAVLKLLEGRGRGPITVPEMLKLYAAAGPGGHHAIHGLLGKGIDVELSKQLGAARSRFHGEVLQALARQVKAKTPQTGFGVNDFGASSDPAKVNAKTDIDFTLYPQADGVPAQWLVAEYNRLFKELAAKQGSSVDPRQLDIVAHRADATIPDWRQQHSVADFELKLRTGRSLLKANTEAYFLEGAVAQQVMGRSVNADQKTFAWYDVEPDGTVAATQEHASRVPQYFYRPQVKPRFAFGGAVGNLHFFRSHAGDLGLESKYLLRTLDDGVGLTVKNKQRDFVRLEPDARAQLLGALYSDPALGLSAKTREKMLAAYEVARNVRLAHSKNQTLSDAAAFAPLMEQIRRTAPDVKLDDAWVLAEARRTFRRVAEVAAVSNVLLSAEPRFKDWYAPSTQERVIHVAEDGSRRAVAPSPEQLTKLQFGAFFEVRDALEVLEPRDRAALKKKLGEGNPRLVKDLEIVERIIAKEREVMLPGDADPNEALDHRQRAAKDVLDAWDALGKTSPAAGRWKGVVERASAAFTAANALETYAQSRMVDALGAAVGPRAGLQLEALRQATADVNERFIGPVWMTRITRANSVVTVLNVWAKGRPWSEVAQTAAMEAVSHLPLLGMVVSVETGGGTAVLNIVFTQVIPGYGQVTLVLTSAKGLVELGGNLLFQPIKRDKVLLAYQGSLKAGSVTAERTVSPRPSILHAVDPAGRLTIGQRRAAVFPFFEPRIRRVFVERYGEGAEPREMPATWSKLEGEQLPVVARELVEQWWNATGPFAADDANVVKRMMDEAFGEELKGELVKQLIGDYVDGKRQVLRAEEAKHRENEALLVKLAQRDVAANAERARLAPELAEAHRVVAELVEGQAQQEAPVAEPRLELSAAPRYRLARDDAGRAFMVVEDLNVRAKLMAADTPETPAPFEVRWRLGDRAVTAGAPLKTEGDPDTLPPSVTVVAEAVAANGRLLVAERLTIPLTPGPSLVGEDVCDEPVSFADAAHCLEQAALEAERLAGDVTKACAEADQHLVEAAQAKGVAKNGVRALEQRVEPAERRASRLEPLGKVVTGSRTACDGARAGLENTAREADQVRAALCAPALPEQVPTLRAQLDALTRQSQQDAQALEGAAQQRDAAELELEEIARDLGAVDQTQTWAVDHRRLVDALVDAAVDAKTARDALSALAALVTRVQRNFDAAQRLAARGDDLTRLRAWKARVDAAAQRDPRCADEVERRIGVEEREAEALSSAVIGLEQRRKALREALEQRVPALRVRLDEFDTALSGGRATLTVLQATITRARQCASDVLRPPTEADVANLLSRTDCSGLPGSVAGYDLRTRRAVCVCPPGLALHANGAVCLSCAGADQACRAAIGRGDLTEALRIAKDAVNCDFSAEARAAIERGMQQANELWCLRNETAVYQDLNAGRLEAAVQRLQALQRSGCRLSQQTLNDVRAAVDLRRRQDEQRARDERAQRELAMWNQLLTTMNQLNQQANQPPPPRPPPATTQPWVPPPTTRPPVTQPPAQPPRQPPPTQPPARPGIDCEKKYCPVCGNDDVMLLGQSTDAQCMDCKKKNARQIQDCLAGGRASEQPDRSVSQFRDHYVVRCVKGTWKPVFRVRGPNAPRLPADEVCTVQSGPCTLVECGFEADRLNAAR